MRKVAELPTRGGFERVNRIDGFERVCQFERLPDSRKFRVYAPNDLKLSVEFSTRRRTVLRIEELFAISGVVRSSDTHPRMLDSGMIERSAFGRFIPEKHYYLQIKLTATKRVEANLQQ